MILEGLLEKKDLLAYINFRIRHLTLEREKIPFTEKDETKREKIIKLLNGRICELNLLKKDIHKVKDMSKYYFKKVVHLQKMKILNQKAN